MTKTAGILVNFAVASIIANGGGADIAEKETEPLDEVKDEVLGDSSDGNLTTLSAKEEESGGREGAEDDISEAEITEEVVEEVPQEASTVTQEVVTSTYEATMYTARCDGCSGITYSGVDVRNTIYHEGRRVIAVDPSVIKLGTVVEITYSGGHSFEAVAEDIGSAIKGRRIDILVNTKEESFTFGRQDVEVRIITEGER